jgi:glycosyltransferase involved in cell wall biosynthesis
MLISSINKKIAVKFLNNSYEFSSRDKREVSILKLLFETIYVVDYKEKIETFTDDNVIFISRKKNYSKFSIVRKFQILHRLVFADPVLIASLKPDLISCHDLAALFIGWLASLKFPKKSRPKIVYDSHEFELGRNINGRQRATFQQGFIFILEKFLINKSLFSIMVNQTIADEVTRIYKLKNLPVVVRNVPFYWELDKNKILETRKYILSTFSDSKDKFLIMYHGNITPGRGVENLIKVLTLDTKILLFVMGNSDSNSNYLKELETLAVNSKVIDRVSFHNAVDYSILPNFVSAVDAGMTTFQAVSKSYYYGLPNKFFEYIQGLTPIISSDYPEVSMIIKKFDIGLCTNPDNPSDIYQQLQILMHNKEMYYKFKENMTIAKKHLNWEVEGEILKNAYLSYFFKK